MTERTFVTMAANGLLQEFKRHIRMTSPDLDAELNSKLLAAVRHAEHHIGKVILRSEFVTTVPFASSLSLKVPNPVVEGLEVDGVSVSGWSLDGNTLYVPSTVTGTTMKVTYEAGYECIPWDMKAAILMHAASLFNNPTDSVEVLTKASQNLLRPYRSWGLDDGEQD
jgi:hypothetical protein